MDEEGHMLVWLRCIWRAELDMRAMERGCQLGSGHVEGCQPSRWQWRSCHHIKVQQHLTHYLHCFFSFENAKSIGKLCTSWFKLNLVACCVRGVQIELFFHG